MQRIIQASASGKIILSGEYAVLFDKKGIALPSAQNITCSLTKHEKNRTLTLSMKNIGLPKGWWHYAQSILQKLKKKIGETKGVLVINNQLPLGKGMGSSTAMIIALTRCIGKAVNLSEDVIKNIALSIENELNTGHSGLDFAVIWEEKPILFQKNTEPELVSLPYKEFNAMKLIDTGMPEQSTKQLIQWVKKLVLELKSIKRENAIYTPKEAIECIGECTERMLRGEPLKNIIRDHHQAQISLGVVPESAQKMILQIEAEGGAAKLIGAGARTGGGGMALKF